MVFSTSSITNEYISLLKKKKSTLFSFKKKKFGSLKCIWKIFGLLERKTGNSYYNQVNIR